MAKLNPRQEVFCHYYVSNRETFGNATHSYAEAFNYDLDKLSRESKRDEKDKIIEHSPYDKAINICAVEGKRLLRNPKIQDRITVLLNELLTDKIVDAELSRVVQQNVDLHAKMKAITEYSKLKGRITDRVEVITPEPIYGGNSISGHDGNKKGIRTQKKN